MRVTHRRRPRAIQRIGNRGKHGDEEGRALSSRAQATRSTIYMHTSLCVSIPIEQLVETGKDSPPDQITQNQSCSQLQFSRSLLALPLILLFPTPGSFLNSVEVKTITSVTRHLRRENGRRTDNFTSKTVI